MTISFFDGAGPAIEIWCRRKESNLHLRVRSSVPSSVGRRLQVMVGERRIELPPLVPKTRMPAITPLPELLVLPRRIELRSLAFQTSVITRPTQAAKVAVPERIELSRSARQADIMATRSWDQLVQAVGIESTNSSEFRFYKPVPYLHGGACKVAESERFELSAPCGAPR